MKRLVIIALSCGLLSACGVKPGGVDAPNGAENDNFPRTYPDIETDPPPGGHQSSGL